MSETRYITTPIFYSNDKPHIGHVYTSTVCDVYARFARFAGAAVFFLTGTDEHGVKVEKAATARGLTPQALCDENSAVFRQVLPRFAITNDDFIRTTDPAHESQVQQLVARLLASGDIYLGTFEGWYDEGQEEYYTDTKAKDLDYLSPVSKKPLTRATEKNYYFRLSAYQQAIEQHFAATAGFVRPEARRNEVLGRLREGLQDVPISRTNFTWGIPMPPSAGGVATEPGHVIYVWIDALFNYITALGLGDPSASSPGRAALAQRKHFWPATYHVIGKEILWFHAVIWPAMLMALKLPLPQCIYAHSFWISEGQKMSKSLGNFIDLETIDRYVHTYGLDAWRYYLVTQGPLGAQDANFAAAHFHEIYTSDLVNTLGNCASRVTQMIVKYFEGAIPPEAPDSVPAAMRIDWPAVTREGASEAAAAMEVFDLPGAVAAALSLIRRVDAFINATEPFKVAKDESRKAELGTILHQCAEAIRIASLLLWPVLPGKMEDLWKALGCAETIKPSEGKLNELARWGGMRPGAGVGTKVQKVALFPRVDAPK